MDITFLDTVLGILLILSIIATLMIAVSTRDFVFWAMMPFALVTAFFGSYALIHGEPGAERYAIFTVGIMVAGKFADGRSFFHKLRKPKTNRRTV